MHSHSNNGAKKSRQWQKGVALGITLSLLLLIILVFTPSYAAVKLSPGTPNITSVTKNMNIVFCYANLTIRTTEAIPVDYLLFTINQSSNDYMIAYVMFTLDGTKLSESPLGGFTVQALTNISSIPYHSEGSYNVTDEETGNITKYNFGYGDCGVDLNILYNITYKTHITGIFYARFFVNSILHTYTSGHSIAFTVKEPSGGGGGGSEPPPSSDNEPPVADAGGPYTGYVNKPITFSGAGSTDDSDVTGYRWDWTNDGEYDIDWSTVAITSHSYPAEGVYTVRLQVKDNENLTDSSTTTVNVTTTTNEFQAPIAEAAGPYKGLTYQNILFDGSQSYGINANITYYLWSFGDGTYGYNATSAHAYEADGTYTVVLTVTDSNNLIAIDMTSATIELDANRNSISDVIDQAIGADITLADLRTITISGSLCYLADTNQDSIFDCFYNSVTKIKTSMGQQQENQLIDINGDGRWDYVYDPVYNTVSPYTNESQSGGIPWYLIGIIVGIVVIIVLVVLFYLRRNCYF